MRSRPEVAIVVAMLALATSACGVVRPAAPGGSEGVRVRVVLAGEDVTLRTFATRGVRVLPRPALPSAWLPTASGAGMVALSPGRPGGALLFVLHEGGMFPNRPSITVLPVSYPEGEAVTLPPATPDDGVPVPPCESWSGFFVSGVGDPAAAPVVLRRWQAPGPSRSMVIDPSRHTLALSPVLRFSTRDVRNLRRREATFALGLRVTAGVRPFLLFGVVRRPDGSYSEAAFMPGPTESSWGAFVHAPGDEYEFSFYALDDIESVRSACRS
jgi:hypothetical protein